MQELLDVIQEKDFLTQVEVEQFYAYAFAQYQSGLFEQAADAFHLLCVRRPFEARFWFGLAATLQEEQKYERALTAWAMVALLDKQDPYPHFHAAECAFSMNNLRDATFALKETEARIDPIHPLRDRIPLLKEAWKL